MKGVLAKLRKGDTLIEVVFALAILATLLTVITTGAISSWRISRLAGERTQATAIAQGQIEALRAYRAGLKWVDFKATMGGAGLSTNFYMNSNSGTWVPVAGSGTVDPGGYSVVFKPPPAADFADPNKDILQFKATVTWKSIGSSVVNNSDSIIELNGT